MDVSRGLRARGNSDATGDRPGRSADVSENNPYCGGTDWRQSLALDCRDYRGLLLFWRFGAERLAAARVPVGGAGEDQRSRQVVDARNGAAHAAAARLNDVR